MKRRTDANRSSILAQVRSLGLKIAFQVPTIHPRCVGPLRMRNTLVREAAPKRALIEPNEYLRAFRSTCWPEFP